LSHSTPIIDDARRVQIAANLGNMVIFGQCFHEVFGKGVIERASSRISRARLLAPANDNAFKWRRTE
jgi:hypothetical protein